MKKLGAAIIGCGWVAEEYLKAFQKDERSEVRVLVSRNPANAERYRDRYDLKCAVETDAAKMLERDDVDIVAVCTPHNAHTKYVVAAAEAGKHIIIEKPVALTPEDVYKQRQAVKKNKVKTIVSFVLHWNPLLTTIDHLIEQEVFGDIFMVEVDYLHRIWALKWYGSYDGRMPCRGRLALVRTNTGRGGLRLSGEGRQSRGLPRHNFHQREIQGWKDWTQHYDLRREDAL